MKFSNNSNLFNLLLWRLVYKLNLFCSLRKLTLCHIYIYRCRCLVKGVLTRKCAWQLRCSSQGHSCISASCVRGCPQRPYKSHWGLQLWSACSWSSPGQSAGHLYDLGRLASDPTLSLVISIPGSMTVQTDWTTCIQSVPVGTKQSSTQTGHSVQMSQTQRIRGDHLSVCVTCCTERGCPEGMPWSGWSSRPGMHAWSHVWLVLLASHDCSGKGTH